MNVFERAIFGTVQKSDETNASYLARHEVQYEELMNMGATLEEMRAYILIRNSGLSSEDKKRIIVDSQGKPGTMLRWQNHYSCWAHDFLVKSKPELVPKQVAVQKRMTSTMWMRAKPEHYDPDETAFFSSEISEDSGLETFAAGRRWRRTSDSAIWGTHWSSPFSLTVRLQHAWTHTLKPESEFWKKWRVVAFGIQRVPKEKAKESSKGASEASSESH